MQIHPAILVDNSDDYSLQIKNAERFTTEVDVDIIDWSRSPNKTISVAEAINISTTLELNFDLMMDHPNSVLDAVLGFEHAKRVIINIAAQDDLSELILKIKSSGKLPAISLNEASDFDKVVPMLRQLDMVQIFTIIPGKQGNPFMVDHLEIVNKLEEQNFMGLIGVDGGINKASLTEVCKYPIDIASVGSAISRAEDPEFAYNELVSIANSLIHSEIQTI